MKRLITLALAIILTLGLVACTSEPAVKADVKVATLKGPTGIGMAALSEDPAYDEVRAIVKVLNFVQEADVDDEIPPTSLVREFIGGNTFYR